VVTYPTSFFVQASRYAPGGGAQSLTPGTGGGTSSAIGERQSEAAVVVRAEADDLHRANGSGDAVLLALPGRLHSRRAHPSRSEGPQARPGVPRRRTGAYGERRTEEARRWRRVGRDLLAGVDGWRDGVRRLRIGSEPVYRPRAASSSSASAAPSARLGHKETPRFQGVCGERMKGLEPSTFCMASRRSSQLSYIRTAWVRASG
jgi:hypothetical protein